MARHFVESIRRGGIGRRMEETGSHRLGRTHGRCSVAGSIGMQTWIKYYTRPIVETTEQQLSYLLTVGLQSRMNECISCFVCIRKCRTNWYPMARPKKGKSMVLPQLPNDVTQAGDSVENGTCLH